MDRRHFAKLSALSLAATQLRGEAPPEGRKFGYATVGLGGISAIFMKAVAGKSQHSKITGLVTGHPAEKGPKFGAMYGVPESSIYTYETFDRIRDNKAIDAVYIGLPNSMHMEYTVRAAEAGKHVLCEKPMANNSAECRRMIDACKAHNVKLLIAYRVHYDATFNKVRDMVRSGMFGEIEVVRGGFYGNKKAGEWRLNKKLAGSGSLSDMGIYPLNATRWILGEEPSEFRAMVSTRDKSGRFAEVEQTVEWTMRFPSGILGNEGSSYGSTGGGFLHFNGSQGFIRLDPAFGYNHVVYKGRTKDGEEVSGQSQPGDPDQFAAEGDHLAECVWANKTPITPGEEGLADMLAIEGIYRAAGTPVA